MTSRLATRTEDGTIMDAPAAGTVRVIEGRSLRQIAWRRLKRDKVALTGGAIILALILLAILAPLLAPDHPNAFNNKLIDGDLGGLPRGRLGGVSSSHLLGVEPVNGRDILSRIIYGARVSLLIAVSATVVSVVLGAIAGVTAGYFGGRVDALISRLMDVLLAFPVLVFSIALLAVAQNAPRIPLLVLVIGFFGWPYLGRIIRGQTLSLREREFVDASRSLGAGHGHIIFRELMPNLAAPLLVYATLIIPTNILQEAALSYLGVGVALPTSSWGQMLSSAVPWSSSDPLYLVVPGLAILLTVLSFNLLGDGLRDALDPRASR